MKSLPQLSTKSVLLTLFAIVIATAVAYYPSLNVPFYLDDRDSIVTNTFVHASTLDPLWQSWLRSRMVGYVTLWANYRISGLDPFAYHIVNIIIHLINGLLVFILSYMLFERCKSKSLSSYSGLTADSRFWALLVTAIWTLHPLNSQVVIYVVQRLAGIVTLFYLLSIIFYIKAREAKSINQAALYGALVLLCVIFGFHSKQNYVTVAVFLYCWELYTARATVRRFLLQLTGLGVVGLLLISPFITEFWLALDKFTREPEAGSRAHYLYTQMIILWDYFLRFFYPLNLQLDIEVMRKNSFDVVVGLTMLAHVALLTLAYRLRAMLPLFFVGVIFYYSSHLVESFIIPIRDDAFEHRTYIANVGLTLALVGLLQFYWHRSKRKLSQRALIGSAALLSVLFSVLIFLRAMLWQDPEAFYANEVRLSPNHPRANASYGNELMKVEKYTEAEPYLKKSVDMNMADNRITASGLIAYMTVLYQQKKYQEASHIVMTGLKHIKRPSERSMLLSNLAVGYIYMGYCDFALGLLNTAINLDPSNEDAKSNMAYCHKKLSGS